METFDAILEGAREHARDPGKAAQPDLDTPPAQVAPTGETESSATPAGQAQPKPAAPDDEDGATPTPDMHGNVPLKALESERAKRQDWKTKAIQAEERQRVAEEKLAALEKPAAAAQPVQQQQQQPVRIPPPPSPIEDPEGFARHQQEQLHQHKLNTSEMMLRQAHQDVDEKLAVFMRAAKENPSLLAKANQQPHPWGWMYSEATKLAAKEAIGDDPKAYEETLRAKIRAEIEAERREGAPTIDLNAPVVSTHRPAPSLAAARSSAPSKAPAAAWTGPVPLGALVGANAASVRK